MKNDEKFSKEFGSRQALWKHLFEYKDGELLWKTPLAARNKVGDAARSNNGRYYTVMVYGVTLCVHRIIFEMLFGDTELEVDHIDGDCYNNLAENLRAATRTENVRNVGARKDSSTGAKGVHLDSKSGKYIAQTTIDGKRKHIGRYTTLEEASAAYKAFVTVLHGEFARF